MNIYFKLLKCLFKLLLIIKIINIFMKLLKIAFCKNNNNYIHLSIF